MSTLSNIINAVVGFFTNKGFSTWRDESSPLGTRHVNLRNEDNTIDVAIFTDAVRNCVRVEPALVKDWDMQQHINITNYNESELNEFYARFLDYIKDYEETIDFIFDL